MKKEEIRKEILRKLKVQSAKLKVKKDKIIKERLLARPEFKEAKVIVFYQSFKSEVDTKALIDEALATGKRVVVPVTVGDGLRFTEIGSLNPFPKERIDLVIVPGVAFSKEGSRLGRGKGFYDRFLKGLPRNIKKIGLAYDLQIVEDLPATTHDTPVDIVITN